MTIGLILAAGGKGHRMCASTPKQFMDLSGHPIYAVALRPFLANPEISEIRIGIPEHYVDDIQKEVEGLWPSEVRSGRISLFSGGKRRQDTVELGVRLLSRSSRTLTGVLVHDAARPFLSPEILDRTIQLLKQGRAVGVGVPVSDTLWRVSSETGPPQVQGIVSREALFAAQTPQGGPLDLFLNALDRARSLQHEFTDEASLFLWAGVPFFLVEGSNRNRKITRPEDLTG